MFPVPSKPFSYTGKGTTRRHAIIKDYEPEIDALYETSAAHKDIAAPTSWDQESILDFVRSVIRKGLGLEVEDGIDLFQSGCDRFVHCLSMVETSLISICPQSSGDVDIQSDQRRPARDVE